MTKAEAIAMLKRIQEPEAWEPQINQAAFEALGMAIKALEQQPCEDTISRQAAIDALKGLPTWWADGGGYYGGVQPPMVALLDPEDAVSAIENLPSAQPERNKGEWVLQSDDYHEYYECDQCGIAVGLDDVRNFCPNCGADMRGEQDE